MVRILGTSFVLRRFWVGFWMGVGHQKDQTMIRRLGFFSSTLHPRGGARNVADSRYEEVSIKIPPFFKMCCVAITDFQFVVTVRFCYGSPYINKIILSCWSFNFKYISSILHLCSPLLMPAGFDITVVWYPSFTGCLPLPISFPSHNFVSSCGLVRLE